MLLRKIVLLRTDASFEASAAWIGWHPQFAPRVWGEDSSRAATSRMAIPTCADYSVTLCPSKCGALGVCARSHGQGRRHILINWSRLPESASSRTL